MNRHVDSFFNVIIDAKVRACLKNNSHIDYTLKRISVSYDLGLLIAYRNFEATTAGRKLLS